MSRRSHTTELGSIACEELGDVGAGREGWLVNNPDILTALDSDSLAIANRSLILILHWSDGSEPTDHRLKIIPDLSPIDAEYISALEWLVYDDLIVLAVGTSCGYLLIYSIHGELIHKQLVNTEKIIRLRIHGTRRDSAQDATSGELCIVMRTTIARFDGADIQSMLQRWFQENHYHFWEEIDDSRYAEDTGNSLRRLPYQLWNVSKYGTCADAAITGIMPPPLTELQLLQHPTPLSPGELFLPTPNGKGDLLMLLHYSLESFRRLFSLNSAAFLVGQSTQRYYSAVTIGDDAVISAYRLSEDRNRSIVGAILSKVVPITFSTITSISKMIWRSDSSTRKPEVKPQPFARASPLTCLKDHPRKGEKLTLSPSGTLAAITDSLGRILLLDTQALVVVRLWKGYRDASCLFVELLVNKDSPMLRPASNGYQKSDYCLCLAIHAPRKGIVEVWQMRTGPRLLTIPCPKGSKILQPTYRFISSMVSSLFYLPLEVFFLNGDSGQLSVLNRTL